MVRPDLANQPRIAPNGYRLPNPLNVGDILTDPKNGRWLVGPTVGRGGFGEIYLVRPIPATERAAKISKAQIEREAHDNWTHVAKVDRYMGPLFAEINFYIRVAQQSSINQYLAKMKDQLLSPGIGMPHYITSGVSISTRAEGTLTPKQSIKRKNSEGNGSGRGRDKDAAQRALEERYRFLVIPRYGQDLESWIKHNAPDGQRLDVKRTFWVALQVLETLQYIHHQGYIHGDVKASNILLSLDLESQRKRKAPRPRKTTPKKQKMTNGHSGPSTYPNGIEPMDVDYDEDTDVEYDYEAELSSSSSSQSSPKSICNGNGKAKNGNQNGDDESWKSLRVYLVDFGLAEKYLLNGGKHREEEEDQRRAHNGTLEFESRDSHVGAICRRSDCEILAFNMLSWLSGGKLPWQQCRDHDAVYEMKKSYMQRIPVLVDETLNGTARGHGGVVNHAAANANLQESVKRPRGRPPSKKPIDASIAVNGNKHIEETMPRNDLIEFLEVISKMKFKDEPDYERLKGILRRSLFSTRESTTKPVHTTRNTHTKVKTEPITVVPDAVKIKSASRQKGPSHKSKSKQNIEPLNAAAGNKLTAKEVKLEKERKKVEEEVVALVSKRFKDENPTPAMIELYTRIEMKKRGFPSLPASSLINGH